MPAPTLHLTVAELHRLHHATTVIDVRTRAEYTTGHVPGAVNIPLDQLHHAVPALREAAHRRPLVVVCASGARSENARGQLERAGVPARSLNGGTAAWTAAGHPVDRPATAGHGHHIWPMDRQVRLAAGALILLALVADLALPGARLLSAAVAAGLVYSALSNTCGMAALLGKLPFNRPPKADLEAALAALRA
ncbi:rhodanese-like domain-containing protein [Nonomuraea sp. NPDC005983]|uniref:rhodanese-like domain-containing protein n=1 Tax=Nonomuraea sp. NPDC005983 TaxID=3155595 RepID=UPI0033B63276